MIAGISIEVLVMLGIFSAIVVGLIFTLFKNKKIISQMNLALINAETALLQKQKKAFQIGANTESGNLHQIIGEFKMLEEYDELITLSTTSKAPSLDLIGIKDEKMDFIEFKKKGANLSKPERKIRTIIENKNVNYVVKDVNIPKNITIETRTLRPLKKNNLELEKAVTCNTSNTKTTLRSEQ